MRCVLYIAFVRVDSMLYQFGSSTKHRLVKYIYIEMEFNMGDTLILGSLTG